MLVHAHRTPIDPLISSNMQQPHPVMACQQAQLTTRATKKAHTHIQAVVRVHVTQWSSVRALGHAHTRAHAEADPSSI